MTDYEGELSISRCIKMIAVGIVQYIAICLGILAVVYLTIGFGTWLPITYPTI